ncbi:MAG: hypothetical protein EOP54_14550 [Sphingobacteriales bacterium]|nr:MAG: hypothetical protein EOP54_14550 [Sphingobacteriales bacterium]
MKVSMVFPRFFKWLGLILFTLAILFPYPDENMDDVNNPLGLLIQVTSFTGLLFMAGSRLKLEDEWSQHIRLNSIQWALLIYMTARIGMKVIAFWTRDEDWLPVDFQINMLLIIFIVLFYSRTRLIPFLSRNKQS